MSYQHPQLGAAIGWKHNHMPGMTTRDGILTGWPTKPWPTDEELATWVAEYETVRINTPPEKTLAEEVAALKAKVAALEAAKL